MTKRCPLFFLRGLIFTTMSLQAAQKQRIADSCWSVGGSKTNNRQKFQERPVLTVKLKTAVLHGESFCLWCLLLMHAFAGMVGFIQAEVMPELHLFFYATCVCAVQGLPSTCRMLHCWMVVCCSWLASCCRVWAVRQIGRLASTSSGSLRALWHCCTATTCCLKPSISTKRR